MLQPLALFLLIFQGSVLANWSDKPFWFAPTPVRAVDYFPLRVGNTWHYNVYLNSAKVAAQLIEKVVNADKEVGEQITYTLRVEDFSIPRSDWPDDPTEYTIQANGDVFCDKCPGYILRSPLTPSLKWTADESKGRIETSRVVARQAETKLGGKTYSDCIVIDTTVTGSADHTTSTFARGVGCILTEYFRGETSRPVRREVLSSFVTGGRKSD